MLNVKMDITGITSVTFSVKDVRYLKDVNDYEKIPSIKWNWNLSYYGKEYSSWNNENKNYKKFLADLKCLSRICDDDDVKIVYLDEDKDEIPIESDVELLEALKLAFAMYTSGKIVTLMIKKKEKEVEDMIDFDALSAPVNISPNWWKMCSDSEGTAFTNQIVDTAQNKDLKQRKSQEVVEQQSNEGIACNVDKKQIGDRRLNYFSSKLTPDKSVDGPPMVPPRTVQGGPSLPARARPSSATTVGEPPDWFINYMQQFKSELLCDVNMVIDERLSKLSLNSPTKLAMQAETAADLNHLNRYVNQVKDEWLQIIEDKSLSRPIESRTNVKQTDDASKGQMEIKQIRNSPDAKFNVTVHKNPLIFADTNSNIRVVFQVQNTGQKAWDDKTELRLVAIASTFIASNSTLTCPLLGPGGTAAITAHFTTPGKQGFYAARYKFFQSGRRFGEAVEMAVYVENESLPTNVVEIITDPIEAVTSPEMLKSFAKKQQLTQSSSINKDDVKLPREEAEGEDKKISDVESNEEGFIFVPMPACFVADKPLADTEPVLVKFNRQELDVEGCVEEKEADKKYNSEVGSTAAESCGPKATREERSSYQKIPNIYCESKKKEEKLGEANTSRNDYVGNESSKITAERRGKKLAKMWPIRNDKFIIRERFKKVLYISRTDKPYAIPRDKREVIFADDPGYFETLVVSCDGVAVDDEGALYPVVKKGQGGNGEKRLMNAEEFSGSKRFCDLSWVRQHYISELFKKALMVSMYPFSAKDVKSLTTATPSRIKEAAATINEQFSNGKHDSSVYRLKMKSFSTKEPIHMKISLGRKWKKAPSPLSKLVYERNPGKGYDRLDFHGDRKKTEEYLRLKHGQHLFAKKFCKPNRGCPSRTSAGKLEISPEKVAAKGRTQVANNTAGGETTASSNNAAQCQNAPEHPVHILPEGLMTGAIKAAYSAYNTAYSAFYGSTRQAYNLPSNEEERLQFALATLYDMGFTNMARNALMLEKHNYNIAEIVETYCKKSG